MKTSNKIPKTFISFLIASLFIWLLITFSKEYTTIITVAVNYINIPQDKLLQEAPIKEIGMSVKASGFKLFSSKIGNKTINLESSILQKKNKSKFYLLTNNQFTKIQKQLLYGVKLQEIIQDTIYLNLGLLTSKKVALKPNLDIKYHVGYDLLRDIQVMPDSIVISGPEAQVEKIDFLELEMLTLNDVKENFAESVAIIKHNKIKTSKLKATISGKVDKFTEGRLQIPFSIINLPKGVNLTTLADKVEVVFVVALSNFEKVSKSSFSVKCDFSTSKKDNLGYLIPKIIKKPDFVKNIKIVPIKIDFLIQK